MRTGIGENYHKIGASELSFKIGRHLSENLRLTVIGLADVLIPCSHAVITAYNNDTHIIVSFRKIRGAVSIS